MRPHRGLLRVGASRAQAARGAFGLCLFLALFCASESACGAFGRPHQPARQTLLHRAAEGFFVDSQPSAVRTIWPSVYAFVCEGDGSAYTATAFLVRKDEREKSARYYFVTAGHAIDDCRQSRRYLAEEINVARFESDGITLARPPRRLKHITTVHIDDAYDIAIVKVEVPRPLPLGAPVRVRGQCNDALRREIYAVGFPGVAKRRSLGMRREAKRWSKGEYVGIGHAEFRGTESLYIASTVDSLPGNSGGPVVDANGDLVGVVVKGAANPENGFRYDVDPRKEGDWHSFLVPCDAVARIIARSGIAD